MLSYNRWRVDASSRGRGWACNPLISDGERLVMGGVSPDGAILRSSHGVVPDLISWLCRTFLYRS